MERAARVLRERLGDEGTTELRLVISDAGQEWKDDVLSVAAERFERRLAEEIGGLRVDIAKEFAATRGELGALRIDMNNLGGSLSGQINILGSSTRAEMTTLGSSLRAEMHILASSTRADLLKWMFLFWVAQASTLAGILAFLLRATGRN